MSSPAALAFRWSLSQACVNVGLAERLRFSPGAGGETRNVTALVEVVDSLVTSEMTQEQSEEILITVWRDEADTEIGGINAVDFGDEVYRSGDDRPYLWTGEVAAQTEYNQRLRFRRRRTSQMGMVHTQR